MHNLTDDLVDRIVTQLDADGHYELVNEILKVKHFTPKKSEYQGGGWGDKHYTDAELRAMQGIYG